MFPIRSRYVLSEVRVDDGVDLSDGQDFRSPQMVTVHSYEDGFYERNEKEFFGFGMVTSRSVVPSWNEDDALAPGEVLRTTRRKFHNRAYALRSRLEWEAVFDGEPPGAGYEGAHTVRRNDWQVREVLDPDGHPVRPHSDCINLLHPMLDPSACDSVFPVVRTARTLFTEGSNDPGTWKTRIEEDLDFDRFGNLTRSLDRADDSTSKDDVYAKAEYLHRVKDWIVGHPENLEVYGGGVGGRKLRDRRATYDDYGNLATLTVHTGSGAATTSFEHDTFGNIEKVTTPPNGANESQELTYGYDPVARQYVTSTTDVFDHTSTATYDLAFGLPRVTTDINDNTMTRDYDAFGRLISVRGPYDEDGGSASVEMSYHHDTTFPHAVTTNRSAPPGDYRAEGRKVPTDITTVTVVDGLGRTVQVSKTSEVNGQKGMTTSGMVSYDLLGRQARRYHPFFTPGASTELIRPPSTPPFHTGMTHDVLDRVTHTRFPDDTEATTTYSIDRVPSGPRVFRQVFTDANGNSLETFTDLMDRTRAVVEHPKPGQSAVTRYDYLATGELDTVVDADGNRTTLDYDLRGLNTVLDNPDTGKIVQRYDLMGNVVERVEPNHRARGAQVSFVYDHDRLVEIDYPSKDDVFFTYGEDNAEAKELNRAGRVFFIRDETGTVKRSFGALGEVRTEVRTIHQVPPGRDPIVLTTQTTFDSLGRLLKLIYPDGEILQHDYDAGGNLQSIEGQGEGWRKNYVSQLLYDVFGNRTHALFGNGVESSWSFDPKMVRLESAQTWLPGHEHVQDLSYEYDPVGNPRGITSHLPSPDPNDRRLPGPGSWSFEYDGVDRLTVANGSMTLQPGKDNRFTQKFSYSKIHNIESKSLVHEIEQPGSSVTTPPHTNYESAYKYDPERPHHAIEAGDLVQKYDPSGNVIERRKKDTGKVQRLTWDDDGRLAEVQQAGTHFRNWYDSEGKRVIKRGRYGETIFANQYFDLRNGTHAMKHVFAGGMRVSTSLSHFTPGAYRPGGYGDRGNGGGGGGGSGGSGGGGSGGGGAEPPGHGGDPPSGHTPPGHDGNPPGHTDQTGNGAGNPDGASAIGSAPPQPPPAPTVAGHPYYYHADHLGSTTVLTTEDGDVHEHLQYFPDGALWIERGPRRPIDGYRFSGKYFDPETGFYDFEQRFYDPKTSLWLGVDPMFGTPNATVPGPPTLNLYAYAVNSPAARVDPDGRLAFVIGAAIVAAVVTIAMTPDVASDDPEAQVSDAQIITETAVGEAGGVLLAAGGRTLVRKGTQWVARKQAARSGSGVVGETGSKAFSQIDEAMSASTRTADTPAPASRPADEAVAARGADVTKRPSGFRKKTVQDAWDDAPTGSRPDTRACPTCSKDVEVAPGQGPRDWDVDHQPPWSTRDLSGKTRKEVLDDYNTGTRLECPGCNRSRGARPAE